MASIKRLKRAWSGVQSMKLNRKFMSSYLLVCIIPLVIVSVIIYDQAANSLEEAAQEFAALYTSQIESSINDFIMDYDRVTKSILIDADIISRLGDETLSMGDMIANKNTINRILMRIAVLKPEVSSLMLVTKGNTVYQYANTSSTVNENILLRQD